MKNVVLWSYRILSYFLPGGLLLWSFVIENIMKEDVSITAKIGCSGLFVLAIMIFLAVFFVNKEFTKREKNYEKLSIQEINFDKRAEYIKKWKGLESKHIIFKNAIVLVVLVALTLLVALLESSLLELRGTLIAICISYASGTGLNVLYQKLLNKEVTNEKTSV